MTTMSKTYDDHIQKYKTQMREAFKNFKATFTDLNLVQILDWRNENGSINHYVRFVFDKYAQIMTVSGDLGTAVFHFTEDAIFENISRYTTMEYFFEKIATTTDRYQYDEEYAYEQVKQYLDVEDVAKDSFAVTDEQKQKLYLAKKMAKEADLNGFEETTTEMLEKYDPDYWEWAYEIGKLPHVRCIAWFEALHLARKQLKGVTTH